MLIALSLFQYWQENAHSMFDILRNCLVVFDKYPVENFPSVLSARTKKAGTPQQIECKHELHSFILFLCHLENSTTVQRK